MQKRRSQPKRINYFYDRCVTRIARIRTARKERYPQPPGPLRVPVAAVGNAEQAP